MMKTLIVAILAIMVLGCEDDRHHDHDYDREYRYYESYSYDVIYINEVEYVWVDYGEGGYYIPAAYYEIPTPIYSNRY